MSCMKVDPYRTDNVDNDFLNRRIEQNGLLKAERHFQRQTYS